MDQAVRIHVSEKYRVSYRDMATGENYPVDLTGEKVPVRHRSNALFIKEPAIYELIFSSHLPAARDFRDWVFEEVLPSVRKMGKYILEDPISKISSIGVDELCAYNKEQRKEYKTIVKAHYNLLKEEGAVKNGRNGGLTTQQRVRGLKRRFESIRDIVNDEDLR